MKKYRLLQLIFFIHYIHDPGYGYGYKFAFISIVYFKKHGIKRVHRRGYHNCTITGIY